MPPVTRIEVNRPDDLERVALKFKLMGRQANETFPVMQRIAMDMMRVTGINFRSSGRRGGGSWQHLRPRTVARKGSTKILMTSGSLPGYSKIGANKLFENNDTLFKSLTFRGAPFQILNIRKQQVEYGTLRPGASAHQLGKPSKGIPQREFLVFLYEDHQRWDGMISRHIVKPWHELTLSSETGY